jgi:hypothetical protein
MALDVQHGGGIYVRGGGGVDCQTFIQLGDCGPNTGAISVRDFRIEDGATAMMILATRPQGSNAKVIFDGFWIASAQVGQRFIIGANTTVSVRDGRIPGGGVVAGDPNWPEAPAVLTIDNVADLEPKLIRVGDSANLVVR